MSSEQFSVLGLLGRAAGLVFLVLLALTAVLVIVSFPAGVYTVFFTHLSNSSSAGSTGTPFLWLGPVAFALPFKVSFGGAFLAATVVYAAMFVLAIRQGRGPLASSAAALKNGVGELFTNRTFVALVGIGFLTFTASIIDSIVSASGTSVGNPFSRQDPLLTLVGFTLAPLREEFGFRVLIIGVAAFAVSLWRSRKIAVWSLWRPSVAYEGNETQTMVLLVIWLAGAFSSGIFGACHLVCGGGGWDLGKLPEATYGGVVLAYLYIKYGFHIAVLAHWGVDYLGSVFAFFGQGLYGIPWDSPAEYVLQRLVDVDMILIFGLASFLVVMYLGLRRLAARKTEAVSAVGSS